MIQSIYVFLYSKIVCVKRIVRGAVSHQTFEKFDQRALIVHAPESFYMLFAMQTGAKLFSRIHDIAQ